MKQIYYLAALLMAGLFCAGCVPERITASPGATGVVLDASTHDALPGATVVMTYSQRPGFMDTEPLTLAEAQTNARPPVAITGTYGQFNIPRQHLWVVKSPLSDWHAYGTLIILKDGYQPMLVPACDTNNDTVARTFLMTAVTNGTVVEAAKR